MPEEFKDIEKELLTLYIIRTIPMIVFAQWARWSLMVVAVLLAADLLIGLPFTALWGFVLVPIGAVASIVTGYLIEQ